MTERRKLVGIYDRPPLYRQRRVWLPVLMALVAVAFWLAILVFR